MPGYGFNFQWMFSKARPDQAPRGPDERALDFMAEFKLGFVRIPTDYRFWTADFDYQHPDEGVLALIDRYLAACSARGATSRQPSRWSARPWASPPWWPPRSLPTCGGASPFPGPSSGWPPWPRGTSSAA